MKTLYILIEYTYDYYEFQKEIAVSSSKKRLEEKYNQLKEEEYLNFPHRKGTFYPLMDHSTHEPEECHYAITEIEIV